MAEFVAQSLAQIKNELEQLKILTLDEKRKILKKRERFEYRLRKKHRQERDFLTYIEYEKDVLQFFKMRKKMRRTKIRVEVPVIMRIHNLYQLCETRFPQNVDTWLQHIAFCRQQKEFSRVGRLFMQMLRTHSSQPELWVQAAQWEVEQSNVDGARTLMQRCVNSNKTSVSAWVEFYGLELEIAKLMRGKGEEIDESDPIVNGTIAGLVWKHACEECPDKMELLLAFIGVADKFDFVRTQQQEMLKELREEFPDVPRVWDFLARRLLPAKLKTSVQMQESLEERFLAVYEEAVTKAPGSEMWTLYLNACLQLMSLSSDDPDRWKKRMTRALNTFQSASDHNSLTADMFLVWIKLLKQGALGQAVEVSELMVQCFPATTQAWTQRLQLHVQSLASPEVVVACLNKALECVPETESWCLWQPVLLYISSANPELFESLLERACVRLVKEISMPAKLMYLRWTATHNTIKAVRELYNRLKVQKPVPVKFFLEYANQELMQDTVKMGKVRRAFEDAITEHGKTDPDLWLGYVKVEMTPPYGDPAQASVIHTRALYNLPKGPLQDAFVLQYGAVVSTDS